MKNGRRKFLGEEKMTILQRHLVEKMQVSDVCDQAGINPTLFYRWQNVRDSLSRYAAGRSRSASSFAFASRTQACHRGS